MSPLAETLLLSLGFTLTVMTLLWGLSVQLRNASIVDPCWGLGFVLIAWLAWYENRPTDVRAALILALTTIWGLRLSAYLTWRNQGEGEDRRYATMREHHGARFVWISLGTVFWLQGILMWFISLPIQATIVAAKTTNAAAGGLALLDYAGLLLWCIGFAFEASGDWQMARFKADPRNAGKVCDQGFWRYTRHPNYFGDACQWWGVYLIAAAGGSWWTFPAPLVMTLLLLKVSGVSLLEKTIVDRRPAYADYQARTNAFIPGPRRK